MEHLGLVRGAAVTPVMRVANTKYNTDEIIDCIQQAHDGGASIIVLPELCITGYTCGDLFFQDILYRNQLKQLERIIAATEKLPGVVVLGFYLRVENSLYNCAAVIQRGQLKGVVPKMFLPNAREYYEARWFASGLDAAGKTDSVHLFGKYVPFGNLLFEDGSHELKLAVEICQDLFVPITPGARLCLAGAHIICNPSASDELVGKSEYRQRLVRQKSTDCFCGYIYSSSGVHESTTDLVFGGHCMIAENGVLLEQSRRFARERSIIYADIDFDRIKSERSYVQGFEQCSSYYNDTTLYTNVALEPLPVISKPEKVSRYYTKTPFIPEDKAQLDANCRESFAIQTAALAKRLSHTGSNKAILGISGGLDSTLALLVVVETFKLLQKDPKDIVAITMPGFGTTAQTHNNANEIMDALGVDRREIPITEAVLQHFKDIGHDPEVHDQVFENAQARERTQILMDLANKENGLQIGTGDLSELALGWCTYNGDHMSMYNVNGGIPKTLVRIIVRWVMETLLTGPEEEKGFCKDNAALAVALQGVLDTPISPELLPPGAEGQITQITEDKVGPYILHDFFLYHTIRYGTNPAKLLAFAGIAFGEDYDSATIKKWLTLFYRRFFSQQFKRSASPDGPKIGSVSLSPRGDWRMPSDADVSDWLSELTDIL